MNIKQQLTATAICLPLALSGLPVLAQTKPLPDYLGPIQPGDADSASELSSPNSLDGTQAFDASVVSVYVPIEPCRIVDTRDIDGEFGMGETKGFWGWVGPGGSYAPFGGFPGECGIPSSATAVHINFTIVDPKGRGFLRAWPNNTSEPDASVLSWSKGARAGNAATISICADFTESTTFAFPGGTFADCPDSHVTHTGIVDFWVKIYGTAEEDLVIDAFGYYEPLAIQP